jgi:hypothetical protein
VKRHEGCSISGRCKPTVKYHYLHRFFTYLVRRGLLLLSLVKYCFWQQVTTDVALDSDPHQRQCQAGSLTGAVHPSNDNVGVLRFAQSGRKPDVDEKARSKLDLDFQYEYRPRKRGLSILLTLRASSKRCQKSYHRDNWLVAAKRP